MAFSANLRGWIADTLVSKGMSVTIVRKIIKWIFETLQDGDSRDLPFHRTSTPELVPEDVVPIWSRGMEQILSSSRGMKQRLENIPERMNDVRSDPRFGPMLLLGALMSFGFIYFRRNQSIMSKGSVNLSQPNTEGDGRPKMRSRRPNSHKNQDLAPSITDMQPPIKHECRTCICLSSNIVYVVSESKGQYENQLRQVVARGDNKLEELAGNKENGKLKAT